MWDALDIGSAPIQVLEPGCGTGNFMAGIPENVKAHVSGVELDPVSARIAAALNPDATILNADLADCTIHPGFDLAIGNVPYSGDISLDYRTMDGGTSRLPLHDYFVERSVDALRPGGVAMLLTSRYTLDKRSEAMRADLARKAELVGVVRLPSSTFARQAGTEAVTDVLVLRKRERTLDRTPDEAWIHSAPIAVPGYQDVTVNVNQAVADDMPAHAVGDIRPVIGRFGGDFDVVFQGDAEQVGERLHGLLSSQMQISQAGPLTPETTGPVARAEIVVRPDHVAPFEYSVDQRGVVWYGDGTTVTEIAHGQGDEARRLRGMIRLRDLARELQRLELDPARVDDPAVETKRVELDQAYDRFTGEFGRLNDRVNRRAYGTEMPGPYLTGPSSIVSQLDRIVRNMATDPGKLTERLADAEREFAAAQETLAEPFAHEDEYRQKQAELERLTSKPDEPREAESKDQETKERSAGMPLTTENARRLLEQDPDITEVTQGGNAMGHYLEARLTDGRAVQIDFHDNPAWKDTDRLAGRIEVSYANRPQAEWQYDDNDMADREHTVIDPADPAAEKTLAKAVEGWERAGGLHAARASEKTSHLAATRPPEEYAYRWRKPGDPDRHIAYLSTAFDRDQAMKARENAGYLVTKVEEDPAILYERHRKASCLHASHILERYDSLSQDAVRILHDIVSEVNAHDPENDIAAYLTYPSDKAVQLAGDGLTEADIAEKREMGGWDPRKDPLMRINEQGDWTGVTQQQADQLVWDNRDEILARASYDSELSTWTLHQLDQLKEPQPAQSLDREAPAQTESTTKRRGPRL